MSWTRPADLRAQVQRRWERGDLLRAGVDAAAIAWPWRLTLQTPTAADLADRFDEVRAWAQAIAALPYVQVHWREWNHRVQGAQRLPVAVTLDCLDDALALVGHGGDAACFGELWAQTAAAQPALLDWLRRRPLQALALGDRWPRLLAIVGWLQRRPRPGVYLREVDLPGVDSKFIEAHRGVLCEWLDLTLPQATIDASASGIAGFARRYGFRDKPLRVRFRMLDSRQQLGAGLSGPADISLDAASFAALRLPLRHVFITENETNFLAFPPVLDAIVVFGAGYGWVQLADARWLHDCDVHYWGDIDTHGFAILDQLRSHLPAVSSLLMDRETLLAHRAHWAREEQPIRRDLPRLDPVEAALYDDLRRDRLAPALRLEQERVGWDRLQGVLRPFAGGAPPATMLEE